MQKWRHMAMPSDSNWFPSGQRRVKNTTGTELFDAFIWLAQLSHVTAPQWEHTVAPRSFLRVLLPCLVCLFVCLQQDAGFAFHFQLQVEVKQQSQEVPVGVDGSFLDEALDGRAQRHVLIQHQVRQYQRGRPTHTHNAMHQHLPYKWR